jgi:hypothetical protein
MVKNQNLSKYFVVILALLLLQNGKCKKNPTGPEIETTTTTTATATLSTTSTVAPGTTTVAPGTTSTVSSSSTSVSTTTITGSNAIAPTLSATSGKTDNILTINVSINGNASTISAFGLEVEFPAAMFSYAGVEKGTLTGNWSTVAANPITGSLVRIGGFAGSGTPIASGSKGTIVAVKLKVTCTSCADNSTANICLKSYTDGLKDMIPKPSCAVFTYKK